MQWKFTETNDKPGSLKLTNETMQFKRERNGEPQRTERDRKCGELYSIGGTAQCSAMTWKGGVEAQEGRDVCTYS